LLRPVEPADRLVDLHAHTVFSDGLFTPEQLVDRARWLGLSAVAVTDHDTVDGLERAREAGRRHRVEIVPGVEMSCTAEGIDVHILGYYMDFADPAVRDRFRQFRDARADRARQMVEKLQGLGLAVTWERVLELAGPAALGRPHVGQAMVDAGVVPDTETAFRRYIGYDGPAYVPKFKQTPAEAIELIKRYAGVAVVAHPGIYRRESVLYAAIAAGADGLEAWHPDHSATQADRLREVAEKNRLLVTGGGDCHGGRKHGHIYLGEVALPYKYLAAVKRLARSRRA
jgi:predicted metal-dependent phosphoesterase TrpH